MKDNIKVVNNYGSGSGKLVSFGFGTIQQAYNDRTVGGINYGYNEDLITGRDFGCQYLEGKLISSRVLDITFGDANENGETPVRVLFANNGVVESQEFKTVDKALVDALIAAAKTQIDEEVDRKIADVSINVPEYHEGDYIAIVPEDSIEPAYQVKVRYDELFAQVKEDLAQEGIDASQNERISEIESTYVKYVELGPESEDGKRRLIETLIRTVDSSTGEESETNVSFEVPTNEFYETLDASLGEIWEELDKKADKKDEQGWIDVKEIIGD